MKKKVTSAKFESHMDQLIALMNAAIYNQGLRKEICERDTFWTLLAEITTILINYQEQNLPGDEGQFEIIMEQLPRILSIISTESKRVLYHFSVKFNFPLFSD
jgi:hypothetical protein